MTVENQDVFVYEGEDKTIEISVTDTEGGAPVTLTNAIEILWRVSTQARFETSVISKTKTGGEITLANDAGTDDKIVIALDSADTTGLGSTSAYHHECRVTDAANKNHVVTVGLFEIRLSNTG